MVELLLFEGADITSMDYDGKTPFLHAVIGMRVELLDRILALDDIDFGSNTNETGLFSSPSSARRLHGASAGRVIKKITSSKVSDSHRKRTTISCC